MKRKNRCLACKASVFVLDESALVEGMHLAVRGASIKFNAGLLAAEGFREALPAVYPLEIGVILSFLSGAVMSASTYYERGGLTSLSSIAAALVSVALSVFVLPRVDYRFAGIFALASYVILFIFTSLIFKKLSGEYPINIKKGAVTLLLTVAYAALLFLFRGVLISRIFLALPLVPLLILSARDILMMIRE